MKKKIVKIIVSGKVQGVWFRVGTQLTAQRLNVVGFVKNLPTSEVEIVAVGDNTSIDKLVEWVNEGTPFANVTSVDITNLEHDLEFTKFEIRS